MKTKSRFLSHKKFMVFCFVLAMFIFITALVSFGFGRFSGLNILDIPKIFLHQIIPSIQQTWTVTDESVLINLRLPRVVAALIVGASLAVSGASYQALFANPVASSDTLGVTSSAAFGAILGIFLNFSTIGIKLISFSIGCVAVLLVFSVASRLSKGRNLTVYLILIGMVASSMFQALLSVLKYVADPIDQLPKITYWLMGSFSNVKLRDLPFCICFFVLGAAPLFFMRWRMNLLSLSEYEAKSMGENIFLLRMVTVICATLLTSSAVAMTGGISWVGLVIPHITRFIVGSDSCRLLPASALMGSLFLLVMDDIARSISVYELPISVLTSLIGAPIFFIILIRNKEQV
ncbi:MAG: iron ABC transporter permease [Lachnospiraceae bacterium]|nr:iron ABC transporter permease [Lachnospiraceae bacterium]